jgi:serine O-acetyltransferase
MSANDFDGAVSKLPTAAQLCSAADEEVADLTDLVWTAIRGQAAAASSSPVLAPFFQTTISSESTLPNALAAVLARKIASDSLTPCEPLADELACIFGEPAVCKLITSDLLAVVEADPAAPELLTVLLHFKGFLALQAHRAAHQLWARENDAAARQLALLLQGRASELFGVDIHPGASIGGATFIDHASGIVIGEQAAMRPKPRAPRVRVAHSSPREPALRCPSPVSERGCNPHRCDQASMGYGCYMLHGVTLGATGKRDKKTGRRHPAVGDRVTLGSGSACLGPITVGDGATVGATAVVTKDVAAGATVIDTSYLNNKVLMPRKPKVQPIEA